VLNRYIQSVIRYFTQHPWWLGLLRWSKQHSLPGLKRIPIYYLVRFILKEIEDDAIVTRANSMSFSFFLAIFPSIIVLFTVLAYTPLYENFDSVLQTSIQQVMPGSAGKMLFKTIEDIATIPRSGLLSFGFFLAMWFSSNGMLSMMSGLEKEYEGCFRQRSGFEKRFIAIELTFLLAMILVSSVIFVILGNTILEFIFQYIRADWFTRMSLFAFRWIVIFSLFYAGISTIYRFGAPTTPKITFFNPGALIATVLSILTSWFFSFYVDNFGNYNKVYGSIGTLIVLMVWIQLNSMILLIGFEVNAAILVLRAKRRQNPDNYLHLL
jgi:membrane protein